VPIFQLERKSQKQVTNTPAWVMFVVMICVPEAIEEANAMYWTIPGKIV
jgi:hypothetical protein